MTGLLAGLAVAQLIVFALIYFFIPESPKLLYEQGRTDEFIEALRKIATINGVQANFEEVKKLAGAKNNIT